MKVKAKQKAAQAKAEGRGPSVADAAESANGAKPALAVKDNRVLELWDILRGKYIFKHRAELDANLETSTLQHWAPNCATFLRARKSQFQG